MLFLIFVAIIVIFSALVMACRNKDRFITTFIVYLFIFGGIAYILVVGFVTFLWIYVFV